MKPAAYKKNQKKLFMLLLLALLVTAAYLTIGVQFDNPKLFRYAMKIRIPKAAAMLITAISIGGASIVFQSIINITFPFFARNEPFWSHNLLKQL